MPVRVLYFMKISGFQRNAFLFLFFKYSYSSVLCSIKYFIYFKSHVFLITLILISFTQHHAPHPYVGPLAFCDFQCEECFMLYTFVLIDKLLAISRLGSPSWMAGLQERDKRMPREHWHRSRFHIGPNCANTNIERKRERERESVSWTVNRW